MQINEAIRDLQVKLNNHYLVDHFRIENRYDEKKQKEFVQVQLWLVMLRDNESEFIKIMRLIRQTIPVHWPVKLITRNEM